MTVDSNQTNSQRSRLASPLLWAGLAVILLGVAFNFGLFFVPITEVIKNPGMVPMPEVLLGWWVVGIGLVMMVWSLLRKGGR